MCGIFGFFLNDPGLSYRRKYLLAKSLASFNDTRGGHSWGYAAIRRHDYLGFKLKKTKIDIRRGMQNIEPHSAKIADNDIVMAHTRWATRGAKIIVNSHPFEIGNIVGAHNGQLWNHDELNLQYGRNFEVDSQHLFAHLESGLDFDDITGYGVVEYIDRTVPERINLCRLEGGELSVVGLGKYGKTTGTVWSSDREHLDLALKFAGFSRKDYFHYEVKQDVVYHVENGVLYMSDMTLSLADGYNFEAYDFARFDEKDEDKEPDWSDDPLNFDYQSEWERLQRHLDNESTNTFKKRSVTEKEDA